MTFLEWLKIGAGPVIGLAGIAYAIYANHSKEKLSNYIKAQNWHMYSKANNASGSIQRALDKYKSNTKDNINIETLEWLSKADAFSQDVLKDIIR